MTKHREDKIIDAALQAEMLAKVDQYDVAHQIMMQLTEYDIAMDILVAKRKRMESDFLLANGYSGIGQAV